MEKTYIAFDTETTGFNCYSGKDGIFSYAYCDVDGNAKVVRPVTVQRVQKLFDMPNVALIAHHLKFDLGMCEKMGVKRTRDIELHDTMIMHQLLNNTHRTHALDDIAHEYCGYTRKYDKEVARYKGLTYDKIPERVMRPYQIADVERTMLLFLTFFPRIKADPQLLADYRNEIQLIKATIDMERYGVKVSKKKCRKMIVRLENEVHTVIEDFYSLTGERFNLGSSKILANFLYEKMKFPKFKMKKKQASTDAEVLLRLRDEYKPIGGKSYKILCLITKYRSYTNALPKIQKFIDMSDVHSSLHPNIKTNHASTGRESCERPPLQGVSRNASQTNPYHVMLRKLFVCRKRTVLLLPDYKGEEALLATNRSKDPEMTKILLAGKNCHEEVAKIFYGKKFKSKKETPLLYNPAKNAHFALIYGRRPENLGKMLNLTMEEGIEAYHRYADRFPDMVNLQRELSHEAGKYGYIHTSFGRPLKIPRDAMHASVNYFIQGTGAGILKRAQVRLHHLFEKTYKNRVRLILPIHDELIIEVDQEVMEEFEKLRFQITQRMVEFYKEGRKPLFDIPLEVEWKKTTSSWAKAEELQ